MEEGKGGRPRRKGEKVSQMKGEGMGRGYIYSCARVNKE